MRILDTYVQFEIKTRNPIIAFDLATNVKGRIFPCGNSTRLGCTDWYYQYQEATTTKTTKITLGSLRQKVFAELFSLENITFVVLSKMLNFVL